MNIANANTEGADWQAISLQLYGCRGPFEPHMVGPVHLKRAGSVAAILTGSSKGKVDTWEWSPLVTFGLSSLQLKQPAFIGWRMQYSVLFQPMQWAVPTVQLFDTWSVWDQVWMVLLSYTAEMAHVLITTYERQNSWLSLFLINLKLRSSQLVQPPPRRQH